MPSLTIRRTAILGLLFFSLDGHCGAIDYGYLSRVANTTRDVCQIKIDDDTLEFKRCILKRASEIPKTLDQKLTKLAIYYYGWLASVVAAKNGIPTSEATARYFLPQFRGIQEELKISDLDLCHTIPGDCVSRNARMLQMQAALTALTAKKAD
jgi:hypothetical protein